LAAAAHFLLIGCIDRLLQFLNALIRIVWRSAPNI